MIYVRRCGNICLDTSPRRDCVSRCAGLLILLRLASAQHRNNPESVEPTAVGVVVLHVNATVFLYYMDLPNERARFSIFWRKKMGDVMFSPLSCDAFFTYPRSFVALLNNL